MLGTEVVCELAHFIAQQCSLVLLVVLNILKKFFHLKMIIVKILIIEDKAAIFTTYIYLM